MRQGEDFGRVGEWYRTFPRGIEGGEEEDEQCDEGGAGGAHVHEGAEAGGEERPHHLREGEEEEGATTEGVDGPEGGEREEPVDETEAEGRKQGLELRRAGFFKDGGAVEGDDVDAAHLLGDHDGESGESGAADTGDGEELDEALGVVGTGQQLVLDFQLGVDVEHVAGDLDRMVA